MGIRDLDLFDLVSLPVMTKQNSTLSKKKKPQVIVAVSGGFDPVHPGHVRMFKEARALGDLLVVILNNDNWLKAKKGYAFMSQQERKEIIESIRWVDKVVISKHPKKPTDMSVANELRKLKPNIFANGGDRKKGNVPEGIVCKEIDCKMVYNIGYGGKVQSSSWLLANYADAVKKAKK